MKSNIRKRLTRLYRLVPGISYLLRNREKRQHAATMVIANKQLLLQIAEKEKWAADLTAANAELAFQNAEKEKRAEELAIANAELAFQNAEKEKRAEELAIANAELAFQNSEKEKRAAELVLTNAELLLQRSELITAEKRIEFDRNNLSALINNTDDLMWSVDKDCKLITFNNAFRQQCLIRSGKIPLKDDYMLAPELYGDQMETYLKLYQRALEGEAFTILDHLDGPAESWSEVSFYPLRQDGLVIGTACYSRDITQRTKNEFSIRAMEQEIMDQKVQEQKSITRAILNAQENERNHIGQELHDNISQILASSKLYLSAAAAENEVTKELIKYPLELIDSSIEEIRILSSKHVTPVKNVDLRDLVQTLLNTLRENTSIDTGLQYDVSDRELNDDLKLNIYRIIQEQINNVVKHAQPGRVDISVQAADSSLHIRMTDDGKGFDVKKKRRGIGIQNMLNRIDSFNGKMDIKSSPGEGCTIAINIPY